MGSLTEDEAKVFLKNMHSAAPSADAALVTLCTGWACKGRNKGARLSGAIGGCPAKKFNDIEEHIVPSCSYCSYAHRSKKSTVSANADDNKRPVKRNSLELWKNNDDVKTSELVNSVICSCNDRTCCVPGLGVSNKDLGLSSIYTTKSLRSLSFNSSAPSLDSILFVWEVDSSSSDIVSAEQPIDTIFKFHKAIRKDLEYLDVESGKLNKCDDTFLQQFIGRFRLLWGLDRARSNAEDDIVFPALESKEALHNDVTWMFLLLMIILAM